MNHGGNKLNRAATAMISIMKLGKSDIKELSATFKDLRVFFLSFMNKKIKMLKTRPLIT